MVVETSRHTEPRARQTNLADLSGRPSGRRRFRIASTLAAFSRSPATWLFAATWVVSELVLVVTGEGSPVDIALIATLYVVFSLMTVLITEQAPATIVAPAQRRRWWLQLGIIMVFIVATAWRGLSFHHVLAPDATLPLWSLLVSILERAGDQWFGNGNYVANPVTYFVLLLLVLLFAGASFRGLGFGPGHRVRRVLLLWCAVPFGLFAFALLAGQLTLERLAGRLVSNALNNGFFEEFLFRGALQTRLRGLAGPAWAVVLQALVFGVWHLGLGFTNTQHSGLLPALASTLAHQAVIGLAFGVVFERTRNLAASSLIHMLANSV